MRISRYGNQNSELLDSFIKEANKKTQKKDEKLSFEKIAQGIFEQEKKPSLREILAQADNPLDIGGEEEGLGGGIGDEGGLGGGIGDEGGFGGGIGDEGGFGREDDLGTDLGDEGLGELGGGADEAITAPLVDALVAACGGLEEAKACLDQHGGGLDEMSEPGIDDEMSGMDGMEEPIPMDDELGGEIDDELGGELGGDDLMEEGMEDPADMAAPMEMQPPAAPMQAPR